MAPIIYCLLFLAGLFLLIKGSEWFVNSAVWTAEVFRIPPIIIGATIVSICTTLPETFVSATAAVGGQTDMAIGNAIGSIAVNTGLILATLIIYLVPVIENRKEFIMNGCFLICSLVLIWSIVYFYSGIPTYVGVLLLILMLLYIANNIRLARASMDLDIHYDFIDEESVNAQFDPEQPMPEGVSYDESENDFDVSIQETIHRIIFFVIGIVFVIAGSRLLVQSGIQIARLLQVPAFLIAVIFTSIGTSLPELVTAISAVKKGVSTLGIGNIMGANILNIVQVMGITALLSPVPLQQVRNILFFQLPFILVMILLAVVPGLLSRRGFSRWNGVLLVILYLIFLTANILKGSTPVLGQYYF
jgi:K+-dependent Na+/Ca+ exchanger related-protein